MTARAHLVKLVKEMSFPNYNDEEEEENRPMCPCCHIIFADEDAVYKPANHPIRCAWRLASEFLEQTKMPWDHPIKLASAMTYMQLQEKSNSPEGLARREHV